MLLSGVSSRRIFGSIVIIVFLLNVLTYVHLTNVATADGGVPPEIRNAGPADGTSIVEGKNLMLYAQGYDDTALDWAWLATNETGSWKNYTRLWSDWQASGSNPIVDGDGMFGSGYMTEDSKIVKVNETYYMFVSSGSTFSNMEIYMLTSSSLAGPWSLMNNSQPIISRSASSWDQSQLRVGGLTYYSGTCYLYYMGTDASGVQAIGVATTSEPEFPDGWQKYTGNPILTPTGTGWESGGVYSLDMEKIGPLGNEWYGHYCATDKKGPGGGYWSTGICYSNTPHGPFTRYENNPILQRGIGQWDNIGLPRSDILKIGDTIYGAYEAASSASPWDFQVGEYSGDITDGILNVTFSKNPNNPIIAGNAGSATQSANPCWWYENGTRYLFAGGGFPSPYRWRYIDLFSSSPATEHGSPVDMHNVAQTWIWSNFTWSNTALTAGTTVQWIIYYNDTGGNVNGTGIHSFTIEAPEYDFVDQLSNVDSVPDKGVHSNFTAQKSCDAIFDDLAEQRSGGFGIMEYRKNLTVHNGYVDGDQSDFPVLVDIYDPDLHTDVQSNGNDISFTDSCGRKLAHQIEYFAQNYNSTHAHLVVWVRANLTDTSDTTICMIYGNPSCESQQSPTEVWDCNYRGVWHLTEDASGVGTASLYQDSTFNHYYGDDFVSAVGKSGIIDGGQEFDGSDDYVRVNNSPELGLANNAAFEAWVKPEALPGYQVVLRRAPNNALLDYPQENYGVFLSNDEIYFEFYSGGTYRYHLTTSANLQTGNWYYLVVVYDNGNDRVRVFLNGTNILDESETNSLVDYSGTNLQIGDRFLDNAQHFRGYIDEVRVSNSTRTASWINTTYQNICNLTSFLSVSSEETSGSLTTYDLDLEMQWTNVNFTRVHEELCIKTGTFSNSGEIQVRVWDTTDNSWRAIMNLTENQWNNVSVTPYLTGTTFTVQFLKSGDTTQHSWNIDGSLLHTWNQPRLEIGNSTGGNSRGCRKLDEVFTITITVSGADSLTGFDFEIHYNTTLIDYVGSTNIWGDGGTITPDDQNGKVTGVTTNTAPQNGALALVEIAFKHAYQHKWKSLSTWTNDLWDTVYLQSARLKHPSPEPDHEYTRGGAYNQIDPPSDFSYRFSPIKGDVNNDGTVDISDLSNVAAHYDQQNPEYNLVGDADNLVDIFDLVAVASNFWFTYTPPTP